MNLFLRNIFAAIAIFGAAIGAAATDVTVQPGGLAAAIPNPAAVTDLTVKGAINAADFDVIRRMTSLRKLNLSGATVAAYDSATPTEAGIYESPANVLPDCALMSVPASEIVLPPGITSIGQGALGNSKVTSLVIPSTVTSLSAGAFSNLPDLEQITIPASVTSLPAGLFKDASKLRTATILASVGELPPSTFRNCTALASVTLPAGLTSIGQYAFAGCTNLKQIDIPASVTTIEAAAFSGSGLTSVQLPAKLTTIGEAAFANCPDLKSIGATTNLTSIGAGAFYCASSLEATMGDLLNNLTDVPDYMLYGASNVDASGLEKTQIESIGNYALSGNASQRVELPATLTHLSDGAMERWDNLTEINAVEIEDVPSLGADVWAGVDQPGVILYVPQNLLEQYHNTPQWEDFNIAGVSTALNPITDSDPQSRIRATFAGQVLMLEADVDIRAAQLYDIAGRCFTIARNYEGNRIEIDTAPFDASIFLLRVLLSDSTVATLKLHRP